METGRDLIFKWVPRMVMFGLYLTEKVPFKDVYMHGMVLDAKGQKMSKSKGNVMSPIDLADEFGMDALRMALIVGNAPGNDIPLSHDKVKAYKKFVNKLWNIARFVLENTSEEDNVLDIDIDNKYIAKFLETKKDITKNIESYQLHLASAELYQYVWHEYADVVIEEIKKDLSGENKKVLRFLFKQILIISHPFMPFVTNEIWGDFAYVEGDNLLLVQDWE
jgi:valyl-tRNA synthetase